MASNKTVGFATGLANAAMFYHMNEKRLERETARDARQAARDKKMGIEPAPVKAQEPSLWDKGTKEVKSWFGDKPANAGEMSVTPAASATPAVPAAPAVPTEEPKFNVSLEQQAEMVKAEKARAAGSAEAGDPMPVTANTATELPPLPAPPAKVGALEMEPTAQEWADIPPMGLDDMDKMAAIPASTFSAASA
jgi:hypothetical protein